MRKNIRKSGNVLPQLTVEFEGDEVVIKEWKDGMPTEHRMSHDEFLRRVTEGLLIAEQGESFEGN